jgi:hypothetical protein
MTPFMVRVTEVHGGTYSGPPGVRRSEPRPIVIGADDQVMTRALAEQLVSEANAVLSADGHVIDLQDELTAGQLSFVMRYKSRHAQVTTIFGHRTSVGRLRGVGAESLTDVALNCPEEVERLILLLIADPPEPVEG